MLSILALFSKRKTLNKLDGLHLETVTDLDQRAVRGSRAPMDYPHNKLYLARNRRFRLYS